MIKEIKFNYFPGDHESEKASNSYLMSLIALIGGLPLPIINLIATGFFYFANRKSTYFVRWHCTQALLSQISMLPLNSVAFWWTLSILFGSEEISNNYLTYFVLILIFNLIEFVATIFTAIQTRKGIHIEWFFYGGMTNLICKSKQ